MRREFICFTNYYFNGTKENTTKGEFLCTYGITEGNSGASRRLVEFSQ
jgi:hypothetical protein